MTQPDLRQLAVAATPKGEWTAHYAEAIWTVRVVYRDDQGRRTTAYPVVCNSIGQPNEANARFIAAANPTAIISLLDSHAAETASLREERDRLRAALEPFATYMAEGGDLDNTGKPLPDDQAVGWIYLTHADFRRAREALAQHGEKE